MRITQGEQLKGTYLDRGGDQPQAYNGTGIGPHARTKRNWTTVTAGYYGVLDFASVALLQMTVQTAVGKVKAEVAYYNFMASTEYIFLVAEKNVITVGSADKAAVMGPMHMSAQDQVAIYTTDLGTGGTVDYDLASHVTLVVTT